VHKPILAITGDMHGEEGRFIHADEVVNKHLKKGDYLFICGDFGYLCVIWKITVSLNRRLV